MPCELNGEPAVLTHGAEGWAAVTVSVEDGLVTAMHVVVNPAKLERLVASFGDVAAGVPDRGRPTVASAIVAASR